MKNSRSRLIAALDVPGRSMIFDAVNQLAGNVGPFKLGVGSKIYLKYLVQCGVFKERVLCENVSPPTTLGQV